MKICLVINTKNNEGTIEKTLLSFKNLVSEIIIIDSGSEDQTKKIVEKFLDEQKIKGKIYNIKEESNITKKTRVVQMAEKESSSDYLLMTDPTTIIEGNLKLPENMKEDCYLIKKAHDSTNIYWTQQLLKKGFRWRYTSEGYDYISIKKKRTAKKIFGEYFLKEQDEFITNAQKKIMGEKKIMNLIDFLKREPKNSTIMRQLAETYLSLNKTKNAKEWFDKSIKNADSPEKKYYATYLLGKMYVDLGNRSEAKKKLLEAWTYKQERIESMFHLMSLYFYEKDYPEAYIIGKLIIDTPLNETDNLFVEQDVYDWKLLDQLSLICYNLGFLEEGRSYIKQIKKAPESEKERLRENLKFF